MYRVVDLFSGAGGLSLGFVQTQKCKVVAAFENNKNAQKTYIKNHKDVKMFDDVCKANYQELSKICKNIDIVIGGPPCQGFSNANRQKNHTVSQNNMLVMQYVRAITELKPKAFVMENVNTLPSKSHRFFVRNNDEETIKKYEISVSNTSISLLDEVYYKKEYFEIIKNPQEIQNYIWNSEDYKLINIIYRQRNNAVKFDKALNKYKKQLNDLCERINSTDYPEAFACYSKLADSIADYCNNLIPFEDVIIKLNQSVMVLRMLNTAKEIFENDLKIESFSNKNGIQITLQSYTVIDYITKVLSSDEYGYVLSYGVLNAADFGAPQKRRRFVLMGIKKEISDTISIPQSHKSENDYATVRDAIADLESLSAFYDPNLDKGLQHNGKNLSPLAEKLHDGNLIYNHIITSTGENAKERFKHIKREAARLQTFPDSFRFYGNKDSQYQQVGNAVPPVLAKSIAEHLISYLERQVQ